MRGRRAAASAASVDAGTGAGQPSPGRAHRVAARARGHGRARLRSATSGWTHGAAPSSRDLTPVTEKLEREHVLEVNRRLTPLFRVLSVIGFVAIAAAIPWFGWHTLIAPGIVAIPVALAEVYSNRLPRR